MTLLFIPMIQQFTHFANVKEINGSIKNIELPKLNSNTWLDESFQQQFEKYESQKFGFANSFIRLQNQLQFSLFKIARANGVVVGKENYLYEKSYISSYYGDDFLGEDKLDEQFEKLNLLKDTLQHYGIKILVVYAPGKGSFYSEYIPEDLKSTKKITNLEYSLKLADSYNIDHIDMSSWFLKMKDTSTYCLYPKTGIHYSYYGARLTIDTILNYCKQNYNYKFPEVKWSSIELKSKLKNTDKDIERGMNLIFDLDNFEMPYQNIKIGKQIDNNPRAIVIADSYYWQLHNMGISSSVFRDGQFWFYNKQVSSNKNDKKWVKDLNLKEELLDQNLILLLCTEPVLKRQYWDFINQAYDVFFNPVHIYTTEDLTSTIEKIRENKNWMKAIEEKASERNISVDSMLKLDALYLLDQQKEK